MPNMAMAEIIMEITPRIYDLRGHINSFFFNQELASHAKNVAEAISEHSSETAAPNIPHFGTSINKPVINIADEINEMSTCFFIRLFPIAIAVAGCDKAYTKTDRDNTAK